jgi:hypothetical protein
MVPAVEEAETFEKRDEQQERDRKMNDEWMKATDELAEVSVFAAAGRSVKQRKQ